MERDVNMYVNTYGFTASKPKVAKQNMKDAPWSEEIKIKIMRCYFTSISFQKTSIKWYKECKK